MDERADGGPDAFDELAAICQALADPHRLHILRLLAGGEQSAAGVEAASGLASSAADRHLGQLVDAGIVRRRQAGNLHYYSLTGAVRTADGAVEFARGDAAVRVAGAWGERP